MALNWEIPESLEANWSWGSSCLVGSDDDIWVSVSGSFQTPQRSLELRLDDSMAPRTETTWVRFDDSGTGRQWDRNGRDVNEKEFYNPSMMHIDAWFRNHLGPFRCRSKGHGMDGSFKGTGMVIMNFMHDWASAAPPNGSHSDFFGE